MILKDAIILFQKLLNTLDNLNHAKELKINFNIRGCK
jgi:hypothetical protein